MRRPPVKTHRYSSADVRSRCFRVVLTLAACLAAAVGVAKAQQTPAPPTPSNVGTRPPVTPTPFDLPPPPGQRSNETPPLLLEPTASRPTMIPIFPAGAGLDGVTQPKVIEFPPVPGRDTTGLVPTRPTGTEPPAPGDIDEVARLKGLVKTIHDETGEINVVLGRSRLLETKKPIIRVAVSNPNVADIEPINDQANTGTLIVYGRSFGTTDLTVWDTPGGPPSRFLVRVTIDTHDLEARLKQVFPAADVRIRQVAKDVILEGQVPDSKTMAELLQVVISELQVSQASLNQGGAAGGGNANGNNANNGQNRGTTGPANANNFGGNVNPNNNAGNANNGAGGNAGGGNAGGGGAGATGGGPGGAGAGGGAAGGGGGGAATTIISNLNTGIQRTAPAYIINRVHIPGPRQVLLRVKIAELNRTAIRQLSVNFLEANKSTAVGSTIGGVASIVGTAKGPGTLAATAASGGTTQLFGLFRAGEFSIFLNALRQNNMAKVLAEPNLVTLDGQPARFLAGGQFPYPVPQSSTVAGGGSVVTIQFAPFGALLSFVPYILADDVIRLDVEPAFSELNFATGTTLNGTTVPGINQRSARTVVEMREGQTLAIAGLLQSSTQATTSRIPGLGDLPIVGPLFSSNSISTVETELVVLVTPELVGPMDCKDVPPAPGDLVIQPNDLEFFFLGRIEGKTGKDFRATVREHDPLNVMKHFRSDARYVVGPHGYVD